MDRADAFQKCWKLALKIAQTGNVSYWYKLDEIAYENDIFVCETDYGIVVEDEVAYFTFK